MIVKIRAILFIYTPLNIEIFECKDLIKERGLSCYQIHTFESF